MSEMTERADQNSGPAAERIRRYLHKHFPHARRQIRTDDDPLLETGVIDSLGILEVVNFLDEEFKIEVSDEDLNPENFASINTLAGFVRRKQQT